jgi:uncharacterized protein YabN with tetrapyrrole methylase and pyrophosphatase domain
VVEQESALRGIPRSAPALYQAYELSKKASKVGFRFSEPGDALEKVVEEAREFTEAMQARQGEVDEAPTSGEHAELGDALFALAALAQGLGIRAEDALEQANARFRQRFETMEALARARGQTLDTLDSAGWLALWAEAKAAQRAEA